MKNYPTIRKNKLKIASIMAIMLVAYLNAGAQLTGWGYKDAIRVQENSGTQKLNYQVLLSINTAVPILAGQMDANGYDIRFSKNCNGSILYSYWIESGINTASTKIWVKVDTLPASGFRTFYMFYGNTNAPAASNFDTTFTNKKIIAASEVVTDSVWNFDWVELQTGSVVTLSPSHPGTLIVNARKIIINGSLDGIGGGYTGGVAANGSGPGGGEKMPSNVNSGIGGGGGGGYGGMGGHGGSSPQGGSGGVTYGTNNLITDIQRGSGGGAGLSTSGGDGGAAFVFNARVIIIGGTVTSVGADGIAGWYTGGGGSGGGILVKGYDVTITGSLTVTGGKGGSSPSNNYGGGGGGGGRVKIFSENIYSFTGTSNVNGGIHQSSGSVAQNGFNGTFFNGTFLAGEPTYQILPHVVLTSSSSSICQGSSVTFTASPGFPGYNFYVNASSAQNGTSATYTTTTLSDNDVVKVLAIDVNGCADTSNPIIMDVTIVNANAGADVLICLNGSTNLSASGGTTYFWSPPTGLSDVNIANPVANPTITTVYTVTVTDAIGCMAVDSVTVTVDPCTGINTGGGMSGIEIYPNPTNGIINISMNYSSSFRYEIVTVHGEVVLAGMIAGASGEQIDITMLAQGSDGYRIYFLKMNNGKELTVRKIILN